MYFFVNYAVGCRYCGSSIKHWPNIHKSRNIQEEVALYQLARVILITLLLRANSQGIRSEPSQW